MPPSVKNVVKISHGQGLYEIQWSRPEPAPVVSDFRLSLHSRDQLFQSVEAGFTVFWCRSVHDAPVLCQGQIHTLDVATQSVDSVNITVPNHFLKNSHIIRASLQRFGLREKNEIKIIVIQRNL